MVKGNETTEEKKSAFAKKPHLLALGKFIPMQDPLTFKLATSLGDTADLR